MTSMTSWTCGAAKTLARLIQRAILICKHSLEETTRLQLVESRGMYYWSRRHCGPVRGYPEGCAVQPSCQHFNTQHLHRHDRISELFLFQIWILALSRGCNVHISNILHIDEMQISKSGASCNGPLNSYPLHHLYMSAKMCKIKP